MEKAFTSDVVPILKVNWPSDGDFNLTIPNKSSMGDYKLEGAYGTQGHNILTECYGGGCENNTLITVTKNHIEFQDNHHNIIRLVREKLPIPVRLVGTWNFVNSSSLDRTYITGKMVFQYAKNEYSFANFTEIPYYIHFANGTTYSLDDIKRGYWTFEQVSPIGNNDINKHTLTLESKNTDQTFTLTTIDDNHLILSGHGDSIIQLTKAKAG
jgi:hypothetical protein